MSREALGHLACLVGRTVMRSRKTVVWLLGGVLAAAGACENGPSRSERTTYVLQDLGPGRCVAMNDAGQIVGVDANQRGFLLSPDGARTDLGNAGSAELSVPLAINANGAIAGYAEDKTGRQAMIWVEGKWFKLTTTSIWSVASGITDDGSVVGVASTSTERPDAASLDPAKFAAGPPAMQGFLVPATCCWTMLGAAGGANSAAHGVGPGRRIVGVTQTAGGESHAFLHENGAMRDLGTLGGAASNAYAVNAQGDVVGVSTLPGGGAGHAFVFRNGAMKDLGTLGGDRSDARSINDAGVIVGGSTTADGRVHPFVHRDEKMIDLLPSEFAQYRMARAEAVANTGTIVGWGVTTDEPESGGALRCLKWTVYP